jgi:hypothetical protein
MYLSRKWSIGIFVTLMVISLVLAGLSMALYAKTIVSWWVPLLIALIPSVTTPLYWRTWKRLTGFHAVFNILAHIFATGSLFCSLVMGLNYLCADKASQHEVRAEITGKWQKKHTRYRHVGRRHHAIPQGSYNTYHIKLEFPDERTKEMSVSLSEYNRARTGRFRTLEVADGLFWMPVIK